MSKDILNKKVSATSNYFSHIKIFTSRKVKTSPHFIIWIGN